MKKRSPLLALAMLFLGIGLGVFVGKLYWAVWYGRKSSLGMRMIRELNWAEEGKRAFHAYQKESSSIAIYVIRYHLDTLRNAESSFATNTSPTNIVATLALFDIFRAEALCHGRLMQLEKHMGHTNQAIDHLNLALAKCRKNARFGAEFQAITNESSLKEWIDRKDRKSEFW